METVEMVVYIASAVIAGGLLLYFLGGLPFLDVQDAADKTASGGKSVEFYNQGQEDLMRSILEFWSANKDLATAETQIYAKDPGFLNKVVLFDYIAGEHLCHSLQSVEMGCGSREDVSMENIVTPAVLSLKIVNDTMTISSGAVDYRKTYVGIETVTFGGFEGQGDLQKELPALPNDSIILGLKLKINSGSDFELYFGDRQCDGNFQPRLAVERYDITQCRRLVKGQNMSIRFTGKGTLLKYFGGGNLDIIYMTLEPPLAEETRYVMPGINGSIQLFSSFPVPGTLLSMDARLHYIVDRGTNDNLELVIGSRVVHSDGAKQIEKTVVLSDSQLRTLLNYGSMSSTTVPIRLSADRKAERIVNVTVQTASDVVLITDLSGSMDDAMGGSGSGACGDADTSKREVAICVDRLFVGSALNGSEIRLGLVAYGTNVPDDGMIPLTSERDDLLDEIDSYDQSLSFTCIPCGIKAAMNILQRSTNNKTIIVMSDGKANHCMETDDPSVSWKCEDEGLQDAIDLADQARSIGIEVYAVAFGSDADPDTMQQIADDMDHYAEGESTANLERIYRGIAEEITGRVGLNATKQIVQTLSYNGTQNSTLYPDSYIRYTYSAISPPTGDFAFRVETRIGGCSNTVLLPQSFQISDAAVRSFSGVFWTRRIAVNGQPVYSLDPSVSLELLGDPFQIYVPSQSLRAGANTIDVVFTSNLDQDIDCSNPVYDDNSFVYSATAQAIGVRQGCRWTVALDDGTYKQIRIPLSYGGLEKCEFSPTALTYKQSDAFDSAAFRLFSELDPDGDRMLPSAVEEIVYYDR
jgi:hypothetical protein